MDEEEVDQITSQLNSILNIDGSVLWNNNYELPGLPPIGSSGGYFGVERYVAMVCTSCKNDTSLIPFIGCVPVIIPTINDSLIYVCDKSESVSEEMGVDGKCNHGVIGAGSYGQIMKYNPYTLDVISDSEKRWSVSNRLKPITIKVIRSHPNGIWGKRDECYATDHYSKECSTSIVLQRCITNARSRNRNDKKSGYRCRWPYGWNSYDETTKERDADVQANPPWGYNSKRGFGKNYKKRKQQVKLIAMEYMAESLTDYLNRSRGLFKWLKSSTKRNLIKRLHSILLCLFLENKIFTDLKSDNVMLKYRGDINSLKLIDLGSICDLGPESNYTLTYWPPLKWAFITDEMRLWNLPSSTCSEGTLIWEFLYMVLYILNHREFHRKVGDYVSWNGYFSRSFSNGDRFEINKQMDVWQQMIPGGQFYNKIRPYFDKFDFNSADLESDSRLSNHPGEGYKFRELISGTDDLRTSQFSFVPAPLHSPQKNVSAALNKEFQELREKLGL